MQYHLLTRENDASIPQIRSVYKNPSIAQYISIDEANYWKYVTSTENVWFYKVLADDRLVCTVHLELLDHILYMDIVVFPKYQKRGIAANVLKDIQNGTFDIDFDQIHVAIDEKNTPSIKLFENAGFVCVAKKEELLEYVYANASQ